MILTMVIVVALVHIDYRPMGPGYCPSLAIGYAHPIKDGFVIAGEPQNGVIGTKL
jgi:hypothetical protein